VTREAPTAVVEGGVGVSGRGGEVLWLGVQADTTPAAPTARTPRRVQPGLGDVTCRS